MSIGERIAHLRKSHMPFLSQKELAKVIGVSGKTIGRWEAGERTPSAEEAGLIADVLGAKVEYLIFGKVSDDHDKNSVVLPTQSARLDTAPKMPIPVISMRTPA